MVAALMLALLAPLDGQTSEAPRDPLVVTLPAPPVTDATPADQPALPEATARQGLMWKISSARNTVYLLGSIHLGSGDFYPLPEHIEEAFEKSYVLVVEVDLRRLDQTKLLGLLSANGLYPLDDSLWNHVSADTHQRVVEFCQQHGVDAEAFARMKPWLAAFATSFPSAATMQQNPAPGIDKYFLDKAGDGMRVESLETAEYQVRVISGLPEAQQERSLRNAVENVGQSVEELAQLQTLWLEGDAQKLEAYLAAAMHDEPEYEKRVFADRNPHMAERAEQCLKSRDRCFIVVGAGHMVGKDGVVHLLRERGYKVERVFAPQ